MKLAKGMTARADLLRRLAVAPCSYLVLDDDGEHGLAYRQDQAKALLLGEHGSLVFNPVISSENTQRFKLPLQMPLVHVIVERQARELNPPTDNPNAVPAVYQPISEDDAKAKSKRLVNYQDLVPKARLLPALKRYLSTDRHGGLDIPRLVKHIAGQHLPRYLPRRPLKAWHSHWVVVLDFAKRLWPYRQDMHQLAEDLLHACGQSGVSVRIINYGPLQHWTDWLDEQRTDGPLPSQHAWCMPAAHTPVLLVSDLGLLEGSDSSIYRAWQVFVEQLLAAQTKPLALLPLGPQQLDNALPNALTLLRWSPDARMHPVRPCGNAQALPEGLAQLLAMAAVTRRVDPPLLRAMRQLNPTAPLNAGLEGAFWCHTDVEAGSAANIRCEAQVQHLAHFTQYLAEYHLALDKLRYRHHAHLRAVLNHEETLLWCAHTKQLDSDAETRLNAAQAFFGKLAATLTQDVLQKGGVWWQVAQDIVQRADMKMGEKYKPLLTPLVKAIAEVRSDWSQLPDWLDPADIEGDDAQSCWLVRDPVVGCIVAQASAPERNQHALTPPLLVDQGGLRIDSGDTSRLLSRQHLPFRLCGLDEAVLIRLTSRRETLILASVTRPRGAVSWGYDSAGGVIVKSPSLCDRSGQWSTSSSFRESQLIPALTERGDYQFLESAQETHRDMNRGYAILGHKGKKIKTSVGFVLDQYGVRADLTFSLVSGEIIQGLRWLEPGSFKMGSPDNEPERRDNEGPQHEVTISQGFWLADTACTQALWQAVMDNNPSRYKDDPQLPVEQVSWHDVQAFLQGLQALLPGCQVDLPSEAEWEYACRAGTETPFSFGATINRQQVNYNFNLGKTVAVKSLPANPWGLYEMHGNVYEWCKDGQREYDGQPQLDPVGSVAKELPRVIRGGSCLIIARRARSAYRIVSRPGDADYYLGFRFCLRSIQPGQEEPAGAQDSASGRAWTRDQAGSTDYDGGLFDKLSSLINKPKAKQ